MTTLKITLVTLAAALGIAGVAHADPPDRATRGYVDRYVDPYGVPYTDRYDRDRRYDRHARWTKLAEVSADPRDGADVLGLDRTGRVDRLELRATGDDVRLERVSVRMRDGRVVTEYVRGWLPVGDVLAIDLPPGARGIASIVLDYGERDRRRYDRTDARLEIWAAAGGRRDDRDDRYDRYDRRYDRWYGGPRERPPTWY